MHLDTSGYGHKLEVQLISDVLKDDSKINATNCH